MAGISGMHYVISEYERLKLALRDRYLIERELGSGGMATVYLAQDLKHHRNVAVKVLKSQLASPTEAQRFLREIELAAKLSHPHILPVHDSGEAEGLLYYVMPYVAGESLRERLDREKQLPMEQVLQYTVEVADALSYAHSLGIVHRDVKPENILLHSGHAVVADFGLARAISLLGFDRLTQMGAAVGTLAYMSPEQACGHQVDGRTDTFALGCVVYEMLTGDHPFTGPTPGAALIRKLLDPPPSLQRKCEAIPPAVESAVLRALARAPEDRFPTTLHFARALQQAAASPGGIGLGEQPRRPAPTQRIGSLVVLPLENLSADPEQDYFVEGMHEVVIGELGRIGALLVISRTSARCYRQTQKPIPQIARELRVDAVLEGSVLRAGQRIRIALRLVDGREDRHLWSNTYERDLRDVLTLQREVAQAVAREIKMATTPAKPAWAEAAPHLALAAPIDPQAYDAYLKGRYHSARFGEGESIDVAIRYYEDAIARAPRFAEAHAGLAHALLATFWASPERLAQGRRAAENAAELDPLLPEAHAVLGMARNLVWDWQGAEAEFKRAIELDPNSSFAHQWYAQYLRDMMRHEESLREARQARELDPLSLPVITMQGWPLVNQHRYDEAIDLFKSVLELDPNYGLAVYNLGLVHALKGMGPEVVAAAHDAAVRWKSAEGRLPTTWLLGFGYALSGQRDLAVNILEDLLHQHAPPDWIAILYVALGDNDTALDCLEKAYAQRSPGLPNNMSEPFLDSLRDHPRFRALRAKIGLE